MIGLYKIFHMRIFLFVLFVVLLSGVLSLSPAYAHKPGQSYVFLRIYDDAVSGTFEVTLGDLNNALDLNAPDERITLKNLNSRLDEIHSYYQKKVQFSVGDRQLPLRFTGVDTRELKIGKYALIRFSLIDGDAKPDAIDIDYQVLFDKAPDHMGLLVIEHFWNANLFNNERRVSLIFSASERRQQLSLSGHSRFSGFLGVVKMGVKHIWKGIDHILFLVALILPSAMLRRSDNWEPVGAFRPALLYTVKIVTLFTIAHTITLSVAALGVFNLPSRLVESIIAVSIIVTALDVIYPIIGRRIGWVVFIFGLFHGFGFAGVLSEIGVLGEHMALSLFGFNLGVEIGQVVVIGFMFPTIYFARKFAFYPKVVMPYGSVAMIFMAVVWLVERAFLDESLASLVSKSWQTLVR